MLLKDIFDKTSFEKFKISNNFKRNIDETHSKQPKSIADGSKKFQKKIFN
jgi:hypothetical protein